MKIFFSLFFSIILADSYSEETNRDKIDLLEDFKNSLVITEEKIVGFSSENISIDYSEEVQIFLSQLQKVIEQRDKDELMKLYTDNPACEHGLEQRKKDSDFDVKKFCIDKITKAPSFWQKMGQFVDLGAAKTSEDWVSPPQYRVSRLFIETRSAFGPKTFPHDDEFLKLNSKKYSSQPLKIFTEPHSSSPHSILPKNYFIRINETSECNRNKAQCKNWKQIESLQGLKGLVKFKNVNLLEVSTGFSFKEEKGKLVITSVQLEPFCIGRCGND